MENQYNVWSEQMAEKYLLGFSMEELSKILGYKENTIRQGFADSAVNSPRKRLVHAKIQDFFNECIMSFDADAREKFYTLKTALMETNFKSFTNRIRNTNFGNRIFAMGYTLETLSDEMKVSSAKLSHAQNNKDTDDELSLKAQQWLDAKYSVLSAAEQERVDLREAAIDIAKCPQRNPFRKQLIVNGLATADRATYRYRKFDDAPSKPNNEIAELKEYIKLLEEENEALKQKAIAADGMVHKLIDENTELKEKLENRKNIINAAYGTASMKDLPQFNFENCEVTINVVRGKI